MVSQFHEAMSIRTEDMPSVPKMTNTERVVLQLVADDLAAKADQLMTLSQRWNASVPFLRSHLLLEELSEFMEAMAKGDIVGCLDALCDIRYVQDGATLALGLQQHFDDGFDEVQRTNMAKLDENGRPVKNMAGRIIKPEGWEPPNLHRIMGMEKEQT